MMTKPLEVPTLLMVNNTDNIKSFTRKYFGL